MARSFHCVQGIQYIVVIGRREHDDVSEAYLPCKPSVTDEVTPPLPASEMPTPIEIRGGAARESRYFVAPRPSKALS